MLTPRADELAVVTAILESADYDDAKQMARDLVKAVAAALERRETFAVFPDGAPIGYGPYWSTKDAERAWSKDLGAAFAGGAKLLRVRPWSPVDEDSSAPCAGCTHPKEIHADKGRCAVHHPSLTGPKAKVKPNWPQCPCAGYVKGK